MKRVLLFALMAVMTVSLFAGCANSTKESKEPAPSSGTSADSKDISSEKAKLKLSIWGDDARKKQLEDIIKKYTDQHPQIEVEVMLIPYGDYQQKLSIMMASKTAPDIAWVSERNYPQFIEADQLMDLSSLREDPDFDYEDIIPSTLTFFEKEHKLYSIPITTPPKVIFFNKTMFEEKGLENPLELHKQGKWDFDRFVQTAAALTDPATGTFGVRLYNNDWKNWQHALLDIIWQHGADIFNADSTKFALNSPEGEQAIQAVFDMMYKDNVHPKPGNQVAFETGKIGMERNNYSSSINYQKITDFEWDIAPFPEGPSQGQPYGAALVGYSMLEGTAYPQQSMDLIKYLSSVEGMEAMSSVFVPTRLSVLESPVFLKDNGSPSLEGVQLSIIDRMDRIRAQVSHKNWAQIDIKIQNGLDSLYTNTANVKEALQRMEDEINPLLK